MEAHRSKFMPMHYRNIDRHGIGNMESEKVKMFDRLKIPVPLVFFGLAIFILMYGKN